MKTPFSPERCSLPNGQAATAIRAGAETNKADADCQSADSLIVASLTKRLDKWPAQPVAPDAKQVIARADFHGAASLLSTSLQKVVGVPEPVAATLQDRRLSYIFWEDRHRHFVGRVVDVFAEAGIRSIVFKGTACAYSVYAAPFERARGDTDIFITISDRDRADEILKSLGFECGLSFARERGASQISYELTEGLGWSHVIDLHWKINNSAVLSRLFTWEELWMRSAPLTSFCKSCRSPSLVDSLLISCFHRLVHLRSPYTVNGTVHYSADRLIWLFDINLLSQALTGADWKCLAMQARRKGLSGACLSGVNAARATFGTDVKREILEELSEPNDDSAVDRYLDGKPMTRFGFDFLAQNGVPGKIQFIAEHVFPPEDYMRAQFGTGWLPALYFFRGIKGIFKLLRRVTRS